MHKSFYPHQTNFKDKMQRKKKKHAEVKGLLEVIPLTPKLVMCKYPFPFMLLLMFTNYPSKIELIIIT